MAAGLAPNNIRALPTEMHTEDLDPMKPGGHQQFWYTVLGLGLALGGFFTAWRLHGSASSTYRIDNQWSALTGMFILALAIERALEPFSRKLGPDATKRKVRREEALGPRAAGRKDRAPEFDSAVEISQRLTAVVIWGVATGLGFLLCAVLNITLMQAVRANGSGQPPFWADLLVTGLVVGAGTKPLHDLVANIERGKNSKKSKRDSR
jgi:hypothetical protein